jgi:hypothetical protein
MKVKREEILDKSERAISMVSNVLPSGTSKESMTQLMRSAMDKKQLLLYDLATFCELEMVRCSESKSYFAGCLMGAAMIEALLMLLCLMFQDDVVLTRQYFHSTQKKKDRNYKEVVEGWTLQQLIAVSEQLGWIPKEIVDNSFTEVLSESFKELMGMTHPEMSKEEVEHRALALRENPGLAMLGLTQELRNSIHGGRWVRGKTAFDPKAFEVWCHFGIHLCAEMRDCLFSHMFSKKLDAAEKGFRKLDELIANLPENDRPQFKAMVEAVMKKQLGLTDTPS